MAPQPSQDVVNEDIEPDMQLIQCTSPAVRIQGCGTCSDCELDADWETKPIDCNAELTLLTPGYLCPADSGRNLRRQ